VRRAARIPRAQHKLCDAISATTEGKAAGRVMRLLKGLREAAQKVRQHG
jgi:hypothetical protein